MALYRTNFTMMHNFQYSLSEIENMIPYEREIYTLMLIEHLEKEKEKINSRK